MVLTLNAARSSSLLIFQLCSINLSSNFAIILPLVIEALTPNICQLLITVLTQRNNKETLVTQTIFHFLHMNVYYYHVVETKK